MRNKNEDRTFWALIIFLMIAANLSAQGASISLNKKIKEPIEIMQGMVLEVDQEIRILEGTNFDGGFRFVQLLNNFNEPIQPADSRAAYKKQKIKFFKEADGVVYLFTKYFAINVVPALKNEEMEILN